MRRLVGLVGILGAVGCGSSGGSNSVKGVASFDVKTVHAVHLDAGGTPAIGVMLSDVDISCEQAASNAGPQTSYNGHVTVVAFPDRGAGSYAIRAHINGVGSGSGSDEQVISAGYFTPDGGEIGVGGTIDVKSQSSDHVSGTFDAKVLDIETFIGVAFNGGHVDDSGTLVWADGGAVPTDPLSGSFDATFCP